MEGASGVQTLAPNQGVDSVALAESRCGAQAPPDAKRPRICWFAAQLDATGSVRCRIVPLGFLSRKAQEVIGPWELRGYASAHTERDDTGRSCHG
jgi:hypothetical protein